MRLTLRTLLAYMDGILEPEDAQDIAKKIQESERASQLLHRIRDVTQRLQSAAPETAERGEGLDPNTVAEYLDNTLPPDQVLDFEKVCLDSDIPLAEVASCHQILTLVLGEPAEVDPESRLRMYQVPQLAATSETGEQPLPPEADEAVSQPPFDQSAVSTTEESPTLPTLQTPYREPKQRPRWLRDLVVAIGSATVVTVALLAAGQLEPGSYVGNLLARLQEPGGSASEATPESQTPPPTAPVPAKPAGTAAATTAKVKQPEDIAPASTASVATTGSSAPAAPLPPGPDHAASAAAPLPPSASTPSAAPGVTATPEVQTPESPAGKTAAANLPAPVPPMPSESPVAKPPLPTGAPPAAAPGELASGAATIPAEQPGGALPPPAQPTVGQYLSTTEVLVRLNPQAAAWNRIAAQTPLHAGDQILSFPTYRPTMLLSNGVTLQLLDGTRVTLQSINAEGVPEINVHFGRLVLKANQQANTRVRLQIGDRAGSVQFGDTGSELKLEVGRPNVSTADPETQPAALVAEFYVTSGKVLWQETTGQEPLTVAAPARFQWEQGPPQPVALEKPPAWDSPEAVSLLDQRAAAALERSLTSDRLMVLKLREAAYHRQKEVRGLALRCLAQVGDFELIVAALNNPEQKPDWPEYIGELRAALARGPELAAAVRTATEKLYGNDGTTLYELLWKYRKRDLTPPEAAQLVHFLDHDLLPIRLLAITNLKEITGVTLAYVPENPAAKRAPLVQKWRQRLGLNASGSSASGRGGPAGTELPASTPPLK